MEQEKLNKKIGTKELETLKPAKVKIDDVKIEEVKTNEKLSCLVKYPDRDDQITISSVKYIAKEKLKVSGLWYKEDEDGSIQKGTALAIFLDFVKVKTMKELIGKEVDTMLDEKGYLCFKAY